MILLGKLLVRCITIDYKSENLNYLYNLPDYCYNDNTISDLRKESVGGCMTEKELIAITIDRYTELQHIKKANGDHENSELDYYIKVTIAKLSSLGVNVEELTL